MIKKLIKKNIVALVFVILPVALWAQKVKPVKSTSLKATMEKGKAVYTQYCLACHQPDGDGVPKMNPPLINTSYVTGDKTKMIAWVLKGSGDTKLPIDGKVYSNNMPSQKALKDDELADVLTYIRNSFGNKATPVTAAQVKAVRTLSK